MLDSSWPLHIFVSAGRTHDKSHQMWSEGNTSSLAFKKFAEEEDSELLEMQVQGYDGVYDTFSCEPLARGEGKTSTVILADGTHSKVNIDTRCKHWHHQVMVMTKNGDGLCFHVWADAARDSIIVLPRVASYRMKIIASFYIQSYAISLYCTLLYRIVLDKILPLHNRLFFESLVQAAFHFSDHLFITGIVRRQVNSQPRLVRGSGWPWPLSERSMAAESQRQPEAIRCRHGPGHHLHSPQLSFPPSPTRAEDNGFFSFPHGQPLLLPRIQETTPNSSRRNAAGGSVPEERGRVLSQTEWWV